ncbi:hypothetical protein C2E23DRAFT_717357 [Lenzites betulinus]|nr:hypothetical protein C2E23DRAFT_717357 [Lenzites betulinus]
MLARACIPKVCPCVGGRCLTASISKAKESFQVSSQRRNYSDANSYVHSQSIFSPHVSPWDQVFEEIKELSEPKPTSINPRSMKMSSGIRPSKTFRPQTATARETEVITDMFSSIFDVTSKQGKPLSSIGLGPSRVGSDMNHLYNKLRSHSQRLRWTTQADEDLDRKKEEMELCETDMQLLEWAMREVFGESQRYADAAQRTPDTAAQPGPDSAAEATVPEGSQLQPSSYPHLLAALMRTFRDKYNDPHLALSMFDHARHLSIASFVFGCTTPAYNELIETRWRAFRDLRGVVDAFEEMRVNGIELDSRTRLLGETVRREVGERDLWQEESALDSGEVWELVARLEHLAFASKRGRTQKPARGNADDDTRVRKRKWNANQEAWKQKVLEESGKEKFQFDRWAPRSARQTLPPSTPNASSEALKNALRGFL